MFGKAILSVALIALAGPIASLTAAPAKQVIVVGAATNLVHVLSKLHGEFQRLNPGFEVRATTAASGSLFAQIQHGAPYDVFLSADTDYPRQLVAAGLGEASTVRTFARGRLVAWTTRPGIDPADFGSWVRDQAIRKVALAQPRTAPYGRAAQAALEAAGVWMAVQPKIVLGENIAQAAQFVETGHAEVGLVALSLVLVRPTASPGRWIEIPPAQYEGATLDHAAVLTVQGARHPAAHVYLDFLTSTAAQRILHQAGYGPPAK